MQFFSRFYLSLAVWQVSDSFHVDYSYLQFTPWESNPLPNALFICFLHHRCGVSLGVKSCQFPSFCFSRFHLCIHISDLSTKYSISLLSLLYSGSVLSLFNDLLALRLIHSCFLLWAICILTCHSSLLRYIGVLAHRGQLVINWFISTYFSIKHLNADWKLRLSNWNFYKNLKFTKLSIQMGPSSPSNCRV